MERFVTGVRDSLAARSSLYNLDRHNQRRHTGTSPITLVDVDCCGDVVFSTLLSVIDCNVLYG